MRFAWTAPFQRRLHFFSERRTRRGKTARFFLVFLIGNLCVTGLVSLLMYARMPAELERQTIDSNRTMLLQISRSLDTALLQVDTFLQQLSVDTSIMKIPDYYADGDADAILRINENLNNLRVVNQHVLSLEICFPDQERVFIPNAGFLSYDETPDETLIESVEDGQVKVGWLAARKIRDLRSECEKPVISVLKYVSGYISKYQPFLIVNIEEDYLRYLSGAFGGGENMELLLVDGENRIFSRLSSLGYWEKLSTSENFKKLMDQKEAFAVVDSDQRYLATVALSDLEGWKYVSIIPFPAIYRHVRVLRAYSFAVIALGVFMSIAFSLYFSRRLNKVFSGLLRLANPDGEGSSRDLLDSLEATLRELREHSQDLESSLRESLPVLRNNILESLFKGRLRTDEPAARMLASYGLELDDTLRYFCVVAALEDDGDRAADGRSRDLSAVVVLDAIREAIPSSVTFASAFTREDELALLFGYSGSDDISPNIANRVREAIDRNLRGAGESGILLGVGDSHVGLDSLPLSYRQGRMAVRGIRGGTEKTIARYQDIEGGEICPAPYSYEDEDAILQALRRGDEPALLRAHDDMMKSVAGCRGADTGCAVQLLGAILKIATELGLNRDDIFEHRDPFAELLGVHDTNSVDRWFRALYATILHSVRDRRASRNRRIAEKAASFISENFDKPLSLHMLSRHVYLSESYLSRIFHEEMGIPVKQYINSIRIEKAKEFLSASSKNVSEVGNLVGYDNPHGFLKFFKEQTGMTPKDYRLSVGRRIPS